MGQHLSEKTKTGRRHIRMTRWTKNPTNGIRPGILIGGQEHLVNPITTPQDHEGWTHGMGAPTGRELPNLTTRDAHKGPPQAEDSNKVPSDCLVMATLHKKLSASIIINSKASKATPIVLHTSAGHKVIRRIALPEGW